MYNKVSYNDSYHIMNQESYNDLLETYFDECKDLPVAKKR